jgi:hypothetical protein
MQENSETRATVRGRTHSRDPDGILKALGAAQHAGAFRFDTGNECGTVRRDSAVQGTSTYRVEDANLAPVDSVRLRSPAGEENSPSKGFEWKRADFLSELDVGYRRNFGLRVSAPPLLPSEFCIPMASGAPIPGGDCPCSLESS